MDSRQIAVVLTSTVDRLRAAGSWCGETHMQKAVYVAQEVAGVPLGFDFIMYKFGPFSFELRDELTSLRADAQLQLDPQTFPYGPKFRATEAAHKLQERFPRTVAKHGPALDFVARQLADKQVDGLERLATAVFAQAKFPEGSNLERARWIHEKKPHVSVEDALAALRDAERLRAEYAEEIQS